ncbi:MAG: HAD-IA family hydrolase [Parvularculaceae bacterium]
MMALEAIIFDVDGTLADTEEVHRRAFNDVFAARRLGWKWTREDYTKLLDVTGGKERIARFMRDWLWRDPAEIDIQALHREKTERYVELVAGGALSLRPGVARLIDEALAAGVKIAIATTTSLENVEVLIARALGKAMLAEFAVISAGDMVERKKPAPDVYEHALAAMRIPAAAAIAIEDSANGLRSALAAGVPCIITTNPYTEDQEFAGALAVLDSLGEADKPAAASAGRMPPGVVANLAYLRSIHAAA